jgi:hypothetical protein
VNTFTVSNYYAGYIPNVINLTSLALTEALQIRQASNSFVALIEISCTLDKYSLACETLCSSANTIELIKCGCGHVRLYKCTRISETPRWLRGSPWGNTFDIFLCFDTF